LKIWIETKPDIILIHLGTNDLGWGLSTSKKTCFQMKLLINEIYMHLPNVHIFLATIIYIPWFYGGRFHKDYNDCLKKLVKSYMKNNKKITLVEMSKNFDKHDLCPDKIHPVDSGYKIMAENWYKALSKLY
jgi:lysophospholipase L1-like esterase